MGVELCVRFYREILFFQAEDGIRDLVRSRGLGDVYKRQGDVDAGRSRADILVDGRAAWRFDGRLEQGGLEFDLSLIQI